MKISLAPLTLLLASLAGTACGDGADSADSTPTTADNAADTKPGSAPTGSGAKSTTPESQPAVAPGGKQPDADPVTALREAVAALMKRPEHDASQVQVQHLLVSFAGAGVRGVSRSKDEAEVLAAKLFARVQAGEDFGALIVEYTNDSPPGIYPMTKASRGRMVRSFGDVGWRLEVGEFGVAGHDPATSPFGWHIIKRLK